MSGIAGIFSAQNHEILAGILEKIKHRGNSSPKTWEGVTAIFGAFSIDSINSKPGPISTPSGERAIVMDGAIYNLTELQKNLDFHTIEDGSNAEVVLHAFEDLGTRIFGRLEGEFALAIIDEERFVLARDRLGIKPLYFGFHGSSLYFASEVKGLVGIADQIHEFPPGHFLISDHGMYPYDPYFPQQVKIDGALDSAEQIAGHLNRAVKRSIPEGAEVGVWLSGGVDSSVIAALARPYVDRLYTFSAGIEGAPDLKYAQQVAQHIGAQHYERIYGVEEMYEVLDKVIYHLESFDAPLVHSAVSNYLVSELASDYVPFVLSGEGGDELFAGYAFQKEYQSEMELTLSIQAAISALHNTALQRVDRSAAAHGTGVAVPFLDPDVVQYALAIPSRWKIRGPQEMEKWPLRQGLADTLPGEVIWRGKSKFWEGSGSGETLTSSAETTVTDEEFENERYLGNGDQLNSKEELLYYRIFKQHFGDSVPIHEIGRTQHI
jgi:asparagine synthase (glutamine-hydrolysing)